MATCRASRLRPAWTTCLMAAAVTALAASTALLTAPPALAVHDAPTPFELDGNATDTSSLDDWDSVFGLSTPYPTPRGIPTVGAGETFVVDGPNLPGGKETSAWDGSNKDIDLISSWRYKAAKVVPDKDNITNAYAKAYSVDHDGSSATPDHLVIYFGADRFANNGDAALGFWFFRNDVALGPNGTFTGEHAVGDILVQVDFVSGGKSSEVQIFQWVGSGGSHGALDELEFAASDGTVVCTADDAACALTNNAPAASPWAYTPKFGSANTFPAESFFEAGIDITALVGEVCFSSFMAETRSSHSETAELKDFALGDFDLCSVNVEKVCVNEGAGGFPQVDPLNETFSTKHTVTIENTGFGAVYDVQLRDDSVAAGSPPKVCAIAAISGGVGTPTIPAGGILFPDNATFIEVADRLDPGPGNAMTVTLICSTGDNPFRNGVSVRSKPTPTSIASVTDSDLETQAEADVCALTLSAGLRMQKWCQGDPGATGDENPAYAARAQAGQPNRSVFLNPATGYKPEVCVDIKLSNTTADQRMEILGFEDTDLGSLLSQIPLDGKGRRTLAPMGQAGDSVIVSGCYSPTSPDGNQTDPGLATYSDTASANGRGVIVPTTAEASDTATCKLCPTCPECD